MEQQECILLLSLLDMVLTYTHLNSVSRVRVMYRSVFLTDVNFFPLSLPLCCSVASDIISANPEQEASYINISRHLIACTFSSDSHHVPT